MDNRKDVSVFKSICWCLLILLLSVLGGMILSLVWGLIIGWLKNTFGFINRLLSNTIVYYIFMTATTADIGRRTAGLYMKLFAGTMEKSRNVGKGFLGAGILLAIYGVFSVVICLISHYPFLDLSLAAIGIRYVVTGLISENGHKEIDNREDEEEPHSDAPEKTITSANYSEESIDGYADYIVSNCKMAHIPHEEAVHFVNEILRVGETKGKEAALKNLLDFKDQLYQQDPIESFAKVNYYLGVLNANGVISEEEMNSMGDIIQEEYMDKMKRKEF